MPAIEAIYAALDEVDSALFDVRLDIRVVLHDVDLPGRDRAPLGF